MPAQADTYYGQPPTNAAAAPQRMTVRQLSAGRRPPAAATAAAASRPHDAGSRVEAESAAMRPHHAQETGPATPEEGIDECKAAIANLPLEGGEPGRSLVSAGAVLAIHRMNT